MSSVVGQLNSKYSEEIRTAFIESKTVNDVTKLMEAFTKAVEQGEEKEQGWPSAAYAVSKSGVTGMTRAIALEVAEGGQTGKGVLINSCCPGYVNTDMTKHRGAKTVDEGAQTPVFLACGDIEGKAGEFVSYSPKLFLRPLPPKSSCKTRGKIDSCNCVVAQSSVLKWTLLTGVRSGSEKGSVSGSSVFTADAEKSKLQQCNHVYNSNANDHSPLIISCPWNT